MEMNTMFMDQKTQNSYNIVSPPNCNKLLSTIPVSIFTGYFVEIDKLFLKFI